MIQREDVWKIWVVAGSVLTAIGAHTIKLPPTWEPAMPYIEFLAGVAAVVTAVLITPGKRGGQ